MRKKKFPLSRVTGSEWNTTFKGLSASQYSLSSKDPDTWEDKYFARDPSVIRRQSWDFRTQASLTRKPEIICILVMQNTEEITATWCDFRTRNAPYLRKHQDFTARFLHRNTISAVYLKVSATGSWNCKLEGKVTWGLAMGSLFHTVSEHGPTSDSFVREEGDAWGQRRSHLKRSTPRGKQRRSK